MTGTGMRRTGSARALGRALLASAAALAALLTGAGAAAADDEPSEAGTTFRTATAVGDGERATADASAGDYLYWVFPADTGRTATVRATVDLSEATGRQGASTWQVDVYDGLRRRQPCTQGAQTRSVAADADSVSLSCTLRTVRTWAEPWANDPLPGSYYIRVSAVDLPATHLGLPVGVEVEASTEGAGASHAVDGRLAAPLVPGAGVEDDEGGRSGEDTVAAHEPDGGWSTGRWTSRWLWSIGGGLLAALAGVGGYRLTRGPGRPAPGPAPAPPGA